jgi:hypothetical protein
MLLRHGDMVHNLFSQFGGNIPTAEKDMGLLSIPFFSKYPAIMFIL